MRRLATFGTIPAISLVTPVIAILVIAHRFGQEAWTSVAVGQSVGALGGLLVALGWPQVGPIMVASARSGERIATYRASLAARRAALVFVTPLTVLVAVALSRQELLAAGLTAWAFTINGLTASWYYIGRGQGRALLVNEAVLRVLATLVACGIILLGGPIESYPVALVAYQIVADVLNNRAILGEWRARAAPSFRELYRQGRQQLPNTVSRLVDGIYFGGAITVVAGVAPTAVVAFASIDRLQKAGTNAAGSLPPAVTSWVASPRDRESLVRRMQVTAAFDLGIGLVAAGGYYLVLPLAYRVLFSSDDLLTPAIAVWSSVALGLAVVNRAVLVHVLILSGRNRYAAWVTTAAAALGTVAIAVGAVLHGTVGAVAAGAAAEFLLLAGLVPGAAPVLRPGQRSGRFLPRTVGVGYRRGDQGSSNPTAAVGDLLGE